MYISRLKILDFFFFPDNGNNARTFFHADNREAVVGLLEDATPDDKAAFAQMLQDYNVLCRIANCNEAINVPELKKFCKRAYLFRVEKFPWAIVSTSTHRGFGHMVDLVLKNNGMGLGNLSESPLESAHKILRSKNCQYPIEIRCFLAI